jgi:hypothetical protein
VPRGSFRLLAHHQDPPPALHRKKEKQCLSEKKGKNYYEDPPTARKSVPSMKKYINYTKAKVNKSFACTSQKSVP